MKTLAVTALLACFCLSPVRAALPPHVPVETRTPVSTMAVCFTAMEKWRERVTLLRDETVARLAAYPDKAAVYATRIYQLASPYDLAPLLEEAGLPQLAARLRIVLRQIDSYRDYRCRMS